MGWIHSYLMEQAPSKRLNGILAISSEGSRVLETMGGVFLTFVAAKMLWVGGVSETGPCSWVNFAKNAYFLCSYRSRQSLRTRMLEDGVLWGAESEVAHGSPYKLISRERWGPARGVSEVAPRLFWVGLQLANLEIAEAALTAVIGEHEAGS